MKRLRDGRVSEARRELVEGNWMRFFSLSNWGKNGKDEGRRSCRNVHIFDHLTAAQSPAIALDRCRALANDVMDVAWMCEIPQGIKTSTSCLCEVNSTDPWSVQQCTISLCLDFGLDLVAYTEVPTTALFPKVSYLASSG